MKYILNNILPIKLWLSLLSFQMFAPNTARSQVFTGQSYTLGSEMERSTPDWKSNFKPTDATDATTQADKTMTERMEKAMSQAERGAIKVKRWSKYYTLKQDISLGTKITQFDLSKIGLQTDLMKFINQYKWVSIRKMIFTWITGVSNNVRWTYNIKIVDRKDENPETRELFSLEAPISDNYVAAWCPGYTAYLDPKKRKLPWKFEVEFPEGEFKEGSVFGTMSVKVELDFYRRATPLPEIQPIIKWISVKSDVNEPTLRWQSKGKWYESSVTRPDPLELPTIKSSYEANDEKMNKFLTFIGFDPTKLIAAGVMNTLARVIDWEDISLFNSDPSALSMKRDAYKAKYREIITRIIDGTIKSPVV